MASRIILLALLAHLIGDFLIQGEWLTRLRFPSSLFKGEVSLTPFEALRIRKHILVATRLLEKHQRSGTSKRFTFFDKGLKLALSEGFPPSLSLATILKATYKGNLLHASLQGISFWMVLVLYPFLTKRPLTLSFVNGFSLIMGYTFLHFLIDQLKVYLTFHYLKYAHHILFFIADQLLHSVTFFLLPSFYKLSFYFDFSPLHLFLTDCQTFLLSERGLWICIVSLMMTVFAGIFIKKWMEHIDQKEVEVPLEEPHTELHHGGYIIGLLERLLIASALLIGHPKLIGYILTAKSIARLKKLKDDKFAEYFLIGNFLSFGFAIAGGVLLRFLITA